MTTSPFSLGLTGRSAVVALAYVVGFFGVLPAALAAFGRSSDVLLGFSPHPALAPLGLVLFWVGSAFMLASMASLSIRGRGLPISHLPPTLLVTRGPYALSRHPIYIGYTVAFAGFGLREGSLGIGIAASLLLATAAAIHAFGFEEPRLARRYGEHFTAYARSVRRLPGSTLVARAVRAWRWISPLVQWLADRPLLFRLGPTLWMTFGAFAGLAAFAATALSAACLEPRYGATAASVLVLGTTAATLTGGWFAARLYRVENFLQRPLDELRRVGFVSWGGYVGLFGSVLCMARAFGMPLLDVLDIVLPSSLLASAIGRLGCLSYGCCGGRPCEHGVVWRRPESRIVRELGDSASVPRIPSQLLSSVHALATFVVVAAVSGGARPGARALLVVLLYTLGRFAVEFSREEPRFTPVALTRGQIACALAFALAFVAWLGLPTAGVAAALPPSLGTPLVLVAPLSSGVLTFVVCGMHLRRVGRW